MKKYKMSNTKIRLSLASNFERSYFPRRNDYADDGFYKTNFKSILFTRNELKPTISRVILGTANAVNTLKNRRERGFADPLVFGTIISLADYVHFI